MWLLELGMMDSNASAWSLASNKKEKGLGDGSKVSPTLRG